MIDHMYSSLAPIPKLKDVIGYREVFLQLTHATFWLEVFVTWGETKSLLLLVLTCRAQDSTSMDHPCVTPTAISVLIPLMDTSNPSVKAVNSLVLSVRLSKHI